MLHEWWVAHQFEWVVTLVAVVVVLLSCAVSALWCWVARRTRRNATPQQAVARPDGWTDEEWIRRLREKFMAEQEEV